MKPKEAFQLLRACPKCGGQPFIEKKTVYNHCGTKTRILEIRCKVCRYFLLGFENLNDRLETMVEMWNSRRGRK